MSEPKYKRHLEYAQAHPDNPVCKNFLSLAGVHAAHAERITLALIQDVAVEIEQLMAKEPEPAAEYYCTCNHCGHFATAVPDTECFASAECDGTMQPEQVSEDCFGGNQ